jgi:hypothetical protein
LTLGSWSRSDVSTHGAPLTLGSALDQVLVRRWPRPPNQVCITSDQAGAAQVLITAASTAGAHRIRITSHQVLVMCASRPLNKSLNQVNRVTGLARRQCTVGAEDRVEDLRVAQPPEPAPRARLWFIALMRPNLPPVQVYAGEGRDCCRAKGHGRKRTCRCGPSLWRQGRRRWRIRAAQSTRAHTNGEPVRWRIRAAGRTRAECADADRQRRHTPWHGAHVGWC